MPNFTIDSSQSKQKTSTNTRIEILDKAPKVMRRPLALIDDHAYAASWPYVRLVKGVKPNTNGNNSKSNTASVTETPTLTILRDDGRMFIDGQPSFKELGFKVEVSEPPNGDKLISPQALKRYVTGERVNAKALFEQVCEVIGKFIDFDKSYSSQQEMCELIACEILSSWFLESFNVTGFLWINGERASGKTQLLMLISQLSYAGRVFLSAGTFASLRDHADSGATLCIDEAENFSHAQFNADKREVLLSGNRKGSSITYKKKNKNDVYDKTYYSNTYCKRVFAAIAKPDPVLASRSIIIPLVRTANKDKANADILDFKLWPHDPQRIVDELWLLALENLSLLSSYEKKVNEQSKLQGRPLEAWRDVLSIALFLDEKGVTGVSERMNNLSIRYQKERHDIEGIDVNTLIVMALCKCLGCEPVNLSEGCEGDIDSTQTFIKTSDISIEAMSLMCELELDIHDDEVNIYKLGKKMSSLGFRKSRQGGTGKSGWKVSRKEVAEWVEKLGIGMDSDGGDVPVGASQAPQPSQPSQAVEMDLDF
jgi:hypothetical protein